MEILLWAAFVSGFFSNFNAIPLIYCFLAVFANGLNTWSQLRFIYITLNVVSSILDPPSVKICAGEMHWRLPIHPFIPSSSSCDWVGMRKDEDVDGEVKTSAIYRLQRLAGYEVFSSGLVPYGSHRLPNTWFILIDNHYAIDFYRVWSLFRLLHAPIRPFISITSHATCVNKSKSNGFQLIVLRG